MSPDQRGAISVAVVTGGHTFEVPGFHRLFRSLRGVDPYFQSIENWAEDVAKVREQYDVTLFFSMHGIDPTSPEAVPQGKVRQALESLGETGQGIVVLHHAILSYGGWPVWIDLVGIEDRRTEMKVSMNERLKIHVANPNHAITNGVVSFETVDESYLMNSAGQDSDVLLTCDHPKSMKTIAWSRTYRNSRVFCYQLGHDTVAWENPGFRAILERGIRWCAGTT